MMQIGSHFGSNLNAIQHIWYIGVGKSVIPRDTAIPKALEKKGIVVVSRYSFGSLENIRCEPRQCSFSV